MKGVLRVKATRVLVVDADRRSREAMMDRLRAAGYDVLQMEDPNSPCPSEMGAEFAVVRGVATDIDAMTDQGSTGGSRSPSLAIGWLMPGAPGAANGSATDLEQAREESKRIFAEIAPLFLDADRHAAFRLASSLPSCEGLGDLEREAARGWAGHHRVEPCRTPIRDLFAERRGQALDAKAGPLRPSGLCAVCGVRWSFDGETDDVTLSDLLRRCDIDGRIEDSPVDALDDGVETVYKLVVQALRPDDAVHRGER